MTNETNGSTAPPFTIDDEVIIETSPDAEGVLSGNGGVEPQLNGIATADGTVSITDSGEAVATHPDEGRETDGRVEKTAEERAQEVVSTLSDIHEIKRSLAYLWLETYDESEASEKVAEVAVSATVDAPDPDSGQQSLLLERLQKLKSDHSLREKAAQERPDWDMVVSGSSSDVDLESKDVSYRQRFDDSVLEIVDEHLEELKYANKILQKQMEDPKYADAYAALSSERVSALTTASKYGYFIRQSEKLSSQAGQMTLQAHLRGRSLSRIEKRIQTRLLQQANLSRQQARDIAHDPAVQTEIRRRKGIEDARQLKSGFLETPRMKKIIDVVAPRIAAGLPVGFFGEIGGAKSSLAKHISREYIGEEPIVVDGGPDVSMAKLFGNTGLRGDGNGGTETFSESGDITRAAIEGRPIIIDEFDTLTGRVRTALNGALLWRPGDVVRPYGMRQDVEVKAGFCIIVTANLKSARYDREKLDLSTLDRLQSNGAGTYHIGYPDEDHEVGSPPQENLELALAMLTNEKGYVELPKGLAPEGSEQDRAQTLIKFVNATHFIQRLFSDPTLSSPIVDASSGSSQAVVRRAREGRTALQEAVISPRGMIGMLRNLTISGGSTTLTKELINWVSQLRVDEDRKIVSAALYSRGLLKDVSEKELKIPDEFFKNLESGN